MKILLLNGSTKPEGNTAAALHELERELHALGAETAFYQMENTEERDCIGCHACKNDQRCVFGGEVNRFVELAETCDGFIFAAPVYFAHPAGRILSLLDRAYYCDRAAFTHKPGAALTVARRAGTVASADVLNKYFTIAEMPVVSSTYWNVVFGGAPGEVTLDSEGMQTVRNLARNMVWLTRCIELGAENGVPAPQAENGARMNFIH